jgi:hypothetical protein
MRLKLSLSAAKLLEAIGELLEAGVHLPYPFTEVAAFEVDYLAAAFAGKLVVRLEPTDRLLGLVTAARARNTNLRAV